ncbi:MAG TPA: ribosomal protein S18-alanine N-acetyltransferase [Sphingomonas sp.]|jgi:ribosomal-protein-alanine N-acetyltransferase|nr:ribosomal protein S18-alanine N-acetyltransferase [Sphingomonas sp.]
MTALTIGDAKPDEVGEVVELMRRAFDPRFGEAWNLSQLAGVLAMPGARLRVARRRGRLLGFALVRTVLDESELMLIAVEPTARRAGVGAALMADMHDAASQAGIRQLHLEVRRGNEAIALYQAHGFAKVGERPHYYRGPAGEVFDAETYVLNLRSQE